MTKMAACLPNYEFSISQELSAAAPSVISKQQHQPHQRQHQMPQVLKKIPNSHQQLQQQEQSLHFSSGLSASAVANLTQGTASISNLIAAAKNYLVTPNNYFVPLHVDCSVEYELPKQPKPPAGQKVEPLLMIHPCYFRKMESQRRSPFVNNMPNSSRNGGTMLVGLAFVSQVSNIALGSTTLSLKKKSVPNNQHHCNTMHDLSSSSQHGLTRNPDQQQKQHLEHQHLDTSQHQQRKPQHNMSLMPQQARYPKGSANYLEHSLTPIRPSVIAIDDRTNYHQIVCSSQQTNNRTNQHQQHQQHQDHLVQNSFSSSKTAPGHWDQMGPIESSIAENSIKVFPSSMNNPRESAEYSIAASSSLGKRDAMISGSCGYSTNSPLITNNNISGRMETNKTGSKNLSSSDLKKHKTILPNRNNCVMSSRIVDKSELQLPRNSKTSRYAAVPSNFQAGPDTTPITPTATTQSQYKYEKISETNNKNNILANREKFGRYLRSHRIYPY